VAELQHSDVAPSVAGELPPLTAYYFAEAPSWVAAVEMIASCAAEYCDAAYELLSAADASVPAAADFVMDSDLRSSHAAHDVSLFYYLEQRHLQLMDLVRLSQLE